MNEQDNVDDIQIARMVHFVIEKNGRPQCRPAIVVHDWPDQGKAGYCNLVVFPDGTNDGKYGVDDHAHGHSPLFGSEGSGRTGPANLSLLVRWETSVMPNHGVKAIRSWHWPRPCKNLPDPKESFTHPDTNERYHHNHNDSVFDVHNCAGCMVESKYVKDNIPSA